MQNKQITMRIDHENGIQYLTLSSADVNKTISLSEENCSFLDKIGADIILDFDDKNKLVGIELIGF